MAFFSMIKVLFLCTTSLALLLTTPASGKGSNYLLKGERLNTGEYLIEGDNKLSMEKQCNLVLYKGTKQTWSSGTRNPNYDCYLVLTYLGKIIIYSADGSLRWSRGVDGPQGNYILVLQSNNEVVRYSTQAFSPIKNTHASDDVFIVTTLNGTTRVSGEEQNNEREMAKHMEVVGDE